MKKKSLSGNKMSATKILRVAIPLFLLTCYCHAQFAPNGSPIRMQGYDAVAYHVEHKAIKGYSDISYKWKGAVWYFHNSKNKELFAADPEKYAPAYNGFCAYCMRRGYKKNADPTVWAIVDGKLYLFVNEERKKEWEKDAASYIKLSDDNWSRVH